jgi:hypothetical protein
MSVSKPEARRWTGWLAARRAEGLVGVVDAILAIVPRNGEPYCLVAMLCGREREKEVWKAKRCGNRFKADRPASPLGVGRGPMKDYLRRAEL